MKKCSGCSRDVDKYAIACQYCGKVIELRTLSGQDQGPLLDAPVKPALNKKTKKVKRSR